MPERITFDEGLALFSSAPLEELRQRAMVTRYEKNPKRAVTFVLDTNPNYTNVCNADCSFCAFYRHEGVKDAYTMTVDEVMERLAFAQQAGVTTVLLQGGLNDNLDIDYYTTIVRHARELYPDLYPHFFTAPEIVNCARVSSITVREVLQALYDAGQRSLPGGGAEILSKRVHSTVSPKKPSPDTWLEVHTTAHKVGFRSTATMMYGHVEEPEDILIHLDAIRSAQDSTPGFTAFIPWSYKRDRTTLRRSVKNWAGEEAYFRILAFSRIYLDNFDHIQATWFSEGKDIGVRALQYGADDFGGIVLEENVHRAANFINKTDHNGMLAMIRSAGFEPLQRNPLYEVVRSYEGVEEVEVPPLQRTQEKDSTPILNEVLT